MSVDFELAKGYMQTRGDRGLGHSGIFSRAEINGHQTDTRMDGRSIDRSIKRSIATIVTHMLSAQVSQLTVVTSVGKRISLCVELTRVVFAELLCTCTRRFTMNADTYHLREATGACRECNIHNRKVLTSATSHSGATRKRLELHRRGKTRKHSSTT